MALMDGHEIGHGLGREKLELFFSLALVVVTLHQKKQRKTHISV